MSFKLGHESIPKRRIFSPLFLFCAYDVYTKLFDSIAWSIIYYDASIWGTKEFSVVNAVENRGMKFCIYIYRFIKQRLVCTTT
jgi:hypothetical protein